MAKLMVLNHGDKFNRFTVIEFSHYDKRHRKHYICKCDCGTIKSVQGSLLVSGNTKSCGCLRKETRKLNLFPNHRGVINQIILGYKRHAVGRNLKFELTFEEVSNLITKPCHYCGEEASNTKITKNCKEGFKYNGIDRINSKIGYESGNVVSCCSICNTAKSNLTQHDFLRWVNKIYKYQGMANQWNIVD